MAMIGSALAASLLMAQAPMAPPPADSGHKAKAASPQRDTHTTGRVGEVDKNGNIDTTNAGSIDGLGTKRRHRK